MTIDEQIAYLTKGAEETIRVEDLRARLERSAQTGKPLRAYLGVDPTAPDLHLGHTVVIRKLKHFQDLGHTAIFLIGDFSAMIGDPTGQSETRPPLSRDQVDANAKTYLDQVFKILDPKKTEVRYNSEWLGKMSSYEVVRLCGHYRLARMLEREDFRARLDNNLPIAVHELLYPLLTAYDAVMLRSDVELGATEQKFNLLVHREIQREYGLPSETILTMPILVGLDGVKKMSKSLGNYVGITEAPAEMFGKLMSVSDELMWRYYLLLTDRTQSQIDGIRKSVEMGSLHPMQAKMDLAHEVVAEFHGPAEAGKAQTHFEETIRFEMFDPKAPLHTETVSGAYSERLAVRLAKLGLCASMNKARDQIKKNPGSVKVGWQDPNDPSIQHGWHDVTDPAYEYQPSQLVAPPPASLEVYYKVGRKQARVKFVFQ
jgi:tyrosyl-tRNA synthetase